MIAGRKALGLWCPCIHTECCHKGRPAAGAQARSRDSPEMGEVMRCVPTSRVRTFAGPDALFGHLCSVRGWPHTDSVGQIGQVLVINLRNRLLRWWKVWCPHLRACYSLCRDILN